MADPGEGEGALKLDYTLPKGTAAGRLGQGVPGRARRRARSTWSSWPSRASAPTRPGGSRRRWRSRGPRASSGSRWSSAPTGPAPSSRSSGTAIGAVNEVVVAVGQVGDAEPASGSITLDVRFEQLPWLRKLGESPLGQDRRWSWRRRAGGGPGLAPGDGPRARRPPGGGRGRVRDLVQGVGTVLIVGLARGDLRPGRARGRTRAGRRRAGRWRGRAWRPGGRSGWRAGS